MRSIHQVLSLRYVQEILSKETYISVLRIWQLPREFQMGTHEKICIVTLEVSCMIRDLANSYEDKFVVRS